MSAWNPIKEEIYNIVDAMTVVGGYNYDWTTYRRIDTYTLSTENCVFSLRYPADGLIEEDITGEDDNYLADQMSQVLARNCEFMLKPVSDMTAVDTEKVIDYNNDALDKALDDIRKAISVNTLNTCGLGILGVEYVGVEFEEITSQGAYYPFMYKVEYRIIYNVARSL